MCNQIPVPPAMIVVEWFIFMGLCVTLLPALKATTTINASPERANAKHTMVMEGGREGAAGNTESAVVIYAGL